MTKVEFILELKEKLSALPPKEREDRLSFYAEMIDDRMEEGLSEADAVASVGSIDEIARQILGDISPALIDTKSKRKRKAWEILLIALGSPIWVSLLIAAFAVVFSLFASLWAIIICLWAVFACFAGCALGGIVGGIILACSGNGYAGMGLVAAGLVCAGLAIFLFYGCRAATIGAARFTKYCFRRRHND